jgi:hypothetical protein
MPSHAPLCGINRPHARHWSRTNRIDPILELPPVTSDTVTVPPPTRSPEPKVTRYIVIRNDQHDGSPHHGKIFIVAGNRPAAADLPGKAAITFRNHSAHPDPTARVPRLPTGPARRFSPARPDRNARRAQACDSEPPGPARHLRGGTGPTGQRSAEHPPRAPSRPADALAAQTLCALDKRCSKGMRLGYFRSYWHVRRA